MLGSERITITKRREKTEERLSAINATEKDTNRLNAAGKSLQMQLNAPDAPSLDIAMQNAGRGTLTKATQIETKREVTIILTTTKIRMLRESDKAQNKVPDD